MKYCRHCGNELCDGAVICPKCGCSVDYENKMQSGNQAPTDNENYSILSILGMIFAFVETIAGLILSIVAFNEAKKTGNQKSLSLAKAGIIVSAVFLGLAVVAFAIWFLFFIIALSMGGFYWM